MRQCLTLTAFAALLGLLAMSNAACAIPAVIAAKFAPPKKVPPEFELPKGKNVLVFVDDMLNPVSYEPIKIQLTSRLNEHLVAHEVAAKTVSHDRLAALIAATPSFNLLSVSEVGQKLGADVVLYVRVDDFALKDVGAQQLWRGRIETTVRMVGVEAGRLWPKGRIAGHTMPPVEKPITVQASDSYADDLTNEMAAEMADKIAKLFYEHEEPYEGGWGWDGQ